MPKFSIIIPVYNVERYLKKCLDSALNQTYNNFEVIVVNDGSTDNSLKIIEEYKNKYTNIIVINQENQGLSVARNNGIKASTGEYFLLLDSDDYIELDLLLKLSESVSNNPDLVRYQIRCVDDNVTDFNEEEFTGLNGIDAFHKIVKYRYVENAWTYLYKRNFFIENNFIFKANMYHEDYGLIPYIIVKANKVNSINYIGYNYVQRQGSIMNNNDYKKTLKKVNDVFEQYIDIIDKCSDKIYKSFLANSLILMLNKLNKNDYKIYLKKLKDKKVFDNVLSDTLSRKIKKFILKINPKIYLKMR